MLEIRDLKKYFGGVKAIDGLDMDVHEGELCGLVGPNGAGKTTLFHVISGYLPPTGGRVAFMGDDITGIEPHFAAQLGIGRTFQLSTLFTELTVFENVFTGFHPRYKAGVMQAFLHTKSIHKEEEAFVQETMDILEFTGLIPHKDKLAGELSSGFQKMLAIAIALTTRPKLLLLDEPVTTLSNTMVEKVMELVLKVKAEKGTTVVIIEHNMKVIMDYCDRIVVLAYGKKLAEGSAEAIRENEEVVEAYLGAMG